MNPFGSVQLETITNAPSGTVNWDLLSPLARHGASIKKSSKKRHNLLMVSLIVVSGIPYPFNRLKEYEITGINMPGVPKGEGLMPFFFDA